jgi:methionyl aminopeptidase
VPNALTAEWLRHGDFTLEPGMTIAIEPMITLRGGRADAAGHAVGVAVRRLDDGWTVATVDGSPAVHVEHTVAVTPTGARILTPVR